MSIKRVLLVSIMPSFMTNFSRSERVRVVVVKSASDETFLHANLNFQLLDTLKGKSSRILKTWYQKTENNLLITPDFVSTFALSLATIHGVPIPETVNIKPILR